MSVNTYDKNTEELTEVASKTLVDAVPTEGSTRPVSSGGVWSELNTINQKIVFETGIIKPTINSNITSIDILYSKNYIGYINIPLLVLMNANHGQNQQIRITGLSAQGTIGCQWCLYIDREYIQYLNSPEFKWTTIFIQKI